MSVFLQNTINGILVGAVLGLSAVGFSLIFGVMDIVDLSHGGQVILGSYIGLTLWNEFGVDPLLSIPVGMGLLFVLGFFFQRELLSRVGEERAYAVLLMTFAAHLIVFEFLNVVFSPDIRSISTDYASSSIEVAGLFVPISRLIGLVMAIVFTLLLLYLIYRTKFGRQIRAVAENPQSAGLCGINVQRTYAITFGIGAALSAASGPLIGMSTSFDPTSMITYTIYALIIVILTGMGRIVGVIAGGIIVGLIISYTAAYLDRALVDVVLFGIFTLALIIRPQGILGPPTERTG